MGCFHGTSSKLETNYKEKPIENAIEATIAFLDIFEDQSKTNENTELSYIYKTTCSGVWIASNLILTANHCPYGHSLLKNKQDKQTSSLGGPSIGIEIDYIVKKDFTELDEKPRKIYKGKVVADDVEHDLALIYSDTLSSPAHSIAKVAGLRPTVGSDVFSIGNPGTLAFSYTKGNVSAYRKHMPKNIEDQVKGPFMQIDSSICDIPPPIARRAIEAEASALDFCLKNPLQSPIRTF